MIYGEERDRLIVDDDDRTDSLIPPGDSTLIVDHYDVAHVVSLFSYLFHDIYDIILTTFNYF